MNRFFLDTNFTKNKEIILPKEESKHACKVLRLKINDKLELVNGKGQLATGKIVDDNVKKCVVKIDLLENAQNNDYHIHIALAPTKNLSRFEWFLEKSTELGIHRITPILSANSERKAIKTERSEKVLISAMKQSKRLFIPQIDELTPFNEFVERFPAGSIAFCSDQEKIKVKADDTLMPSHHPILIGPEGDFSDKEIKKALSFGYKALTLGKTRLRTETAGVYACMLAKNKFE